MTFKCCAAFLICYLVSLYDQFSNFWGTWSDRLVTQNIFALKNKRRCILSSSIHLQSHNWWMEKKAGSQDTFWKTWWSWLRRGTMGKDIQLAHVYTEKQLKSNRNYCTFIWALWLVQSRRLKFKFILTMYNFIQVVSCFNRWHHSIPDLPVFFEKALFTL